MVPSHVKKIKGNIANHSASKIEKLDEIAKLFQNFDTRKIWQIWRVLYILNKSIAKNLHTLPGLNDFTCKFYQAFKGEIANFTETGENRRGDSFYELV